MDRNPRDVNDSGDTFLQTLAGAVRRELQSYEPLILPRVGAAFWRMDGFGDKGDCVDLVVGGVLMHAR